MGDISEKDKKKRGHLSGVRDARRAPARGRPTNTETPAAHQAHTARGPEGESDSLSLYLLHCHYTIYGNGPISQLPGLPSLTQPADMPSRRERAAPRRGSHRARRSSANPP